MLGKLPITSHAVAAFGNRAASEAAPHLTNGSASLRARPDRRAEPCRLRTRTKRLIPKDRSKPAAFFLIWQRAWRLTRLEGFPARKIVKLIGDPLVVARQRFEVFLLRYEMLGALEKIGSLLPMLIGAHLEVFGWVVPRGVV